MCIKVKREVLSGLFEKKNDVILKFLDCGTASGSAWVSKSSQIDKKDFEILFGEIISDGVKPARMLAKAMDDADCASGIGRSDSGMVESNLFFLGIEKSLKDGVMLILGLANEFLMHFSKDYFVTK